MTLARNLRGPGASAALALMLGVAASGADNKEQFKVILERNPFGLKEPVAQPVVPTPSPEPPKTVKLSGIVSIIGPPRAMLVRQEPGQTKPDYLTLREGEKDGAVEIIRIDADAGEVEIVNGGVKKVLNFKDDKPTGPAPAVAGIPGATSGAQPLGGVVRNTPQPTASWIQPGSSGATPGVAPAAPAGGTAGPVMQPDLRPTPSRQIRTTIQPQANAVPPAPPQIDPVKQELMMRGMEIYHKDAIVRGDFPPFPTSAPPPAPPVPPVPPVP